MPWGVPWGQTEFQFKLELGLTPNPTRIPRDPESHANPTCSREVPSSDEWGCWLCLTVRPGEGASRVLSKAPPASSQAAGCLSVKVPVVSFRLPKLLILDHPPTRNLFLTDP